MFTLLILTYLVSISQQDDDRATLLSSHFNESVEWTPKDRHWDINSVSQSEEKNKNSDSYDLDIDEAVKKALDGNNAENITDSPNDDLDEQEWRDSDKGRNFNSTDKKPSTDDYAKKEGNQDKEEDHGRIVPPEKEKIVNDKINNNITPQPNVKTITPTTEQATTSKLIEDTTTSIINQTTTEGVKIDEKSKLENLNTSAAQNHSSVNEVVDHQNLIDNKSSNASISENDIPESEGVAIEKSRNRFKGKDTPVNVHDDSSMNSNGISEQHHRIPNETPNNKPENKNTSEEKLPLIIPVKVPKEKPELNIPIKSRKTGRVRVEIPSDRQTLLTDQNKKNITVKVPLFRSTVLSTGRHSITFHMSHGTYGGIENWVMVVVKLRKDRFGRPLFLKGSPMEYKGKFLRYEDSPGYDEPYITAGFPPDSAPYKFTIGDGDKYQKYLNGELYSDENYAVFMAGIVHGFVGGLVFVESGWLVDAHAPDVPTYFHTNPHPSYLWPLFLLLSCCAALSVVCWYFWKNGTLSPFVDKMRANARRKSRFRTGYKFGSPNQKDSQKPGKSGRKSKAYEDDVVDSYYQFGNNNPTLPKMTRPKKAKKNKHKRTAHNNAGNYDDMWNSPHGGDVIMSSHGALPLQRHFTSDHELEETVVNMSPSTDRSRW